jgi:hypothetical protein
MADDQTPPEEDLSSQTDTANGDENDWGDDWESAFQAEDDMFFSDEGEDAEDEFFLDDDEETQGTGKDATGASKQSLKSTTEAQQAEIPGGAAPPSITAAFALLFNVIKSATLKPLHRLQALPFYFRFPAYGLLALLAIGIVFLVNQSPTPDNDLEKLKATADSIKDVPASMAPQQSQINEGLPLEQAIPEQIRKKWVFSSFFIPVRSQQKDQALTFVLVEITLVAVLDEKEELPTDKKPFVRDIIYQFYKNRPLEELHRFSLARGEMNRKLKSWLQKQWPDGPVESIIFTRYRLT